MSANLLRQQQKARFPVSPLTEFGVLKSQRYRFVDLFAGVGGFHSGFASAGHECVFACEIDPELRDLYKKNYGITPHDDIRTLKPFDVPSHDVLCAGFPCQPFSLAGKKKGAACPSSGRLIDDVIRIVEFHEPRYVMLENVPNILTIAEGSFWKYIQRKFSSLGYKLEYKVISPVDVGIPQNRQRVFIVGFRDTEDLKQFTWPTLTGGIKPSLHDFLEVKSQTAKPLEARKALLLSKWQSLLDALNITSHPSLSICAPEFGANYPQDFSRLSLGELKAFKGAYGQSLESCRTWKAALDKLPSYVRKNRRVPEWISGSVKHSRELYRLNTAACDNWVNDFDKEFNSWQILEWRGDPAKLDIFDHLIQFRASGIRVLRPDIAPSLISMTPTQVPVLPKQSRYLAPEEAAKLQFLENLNHLPENRIKAFKAFGNAVNARIVAMIARSLAP